MHKFIECPELGFIRDIPAELIKLEKQNAKLIESFSAFKKKAFTIAATTGAVVAVELVILIVQAIKEKKNEKRKQFIFPG
ncbi:MAG: hypothetical protein AB7O73_15440 [Bacteroidia bacterium]